MQDSENKPSEPNESAPSPEPSPQPAPNQPFNPPGFGIREIQATYEMIVNSKQAIQRNEHWSGTEVQPMAMLLAMLSQMESQYRSNLERARADEKEALKRAKEEIRKAGGQVNGDAAAHVPLTPAA